MAFQDEAAPHGGPVLGALKRLGGREPFILESRSSFALIGYAGSYRPSWITQAQAKRFQGPSIVTASIEPGNWYSLKSSIVSLSFIPIARNFRDT